MATRHTAATAADAHTLGTLARPGCKTSTTCASLMLNLSSIDDEHEQHGWLRLLGIRLLHLTPPQLAGGRKAAFAASLAPKHCNNPRHPAATYKLATTEQLVCQEFPGPDGARLVPHGCYCTA